MAKFFWYCDRTKIIPPTSALCEATWSASSTEWTTATCCGDKGHPPRPHLELKRFACAVWTKRSTFYAKQTTRLYQPPPPSGLRYPSVHPLWEHLSAGDEDSRYDSETDFYCGNPTAHHPRESGSGRQPKSSQQTTAHSLTSQTQKLRCD